MPSADGRKLSVTHFAANSLLTIVDLEKVQPEKTIETGLTGMWWSGWHPDGKRLFFGGEDGAGIIDVATGRPIARIAGFKEGVTGISLAPDGKTFALRGGEKGKICIYNLDDLPK